MGRRSAGAVASPMAGVVEVAVRRVVRQRLRAESQVVVQRREKPMRVSVEALVDQMSQKGITLLIDRCEKVRARAER